MRFIFKIIIVSHCDRVIEIGLRVQFVLVHLLWTAECRWKKCRSLLSTCNGGPMSARLMVVRRWHFRIRIRIKGIQDEPMACHEA